MKVKISLLSFALLFSACSSKDDSGSKSSAASPGMDSEDRQQSRADRRSMTTGKSLVVTTTLSNEASFDSSLSQGQLSKVAFQLDEVIRKEPDNLPILITYMSVLRLYGMNPSLQQQIEKKAGMAGGAKNPWFLMEASYSALKKREFALAKYLLDKAEKFAKTSVEKQALLHAEGLRLLMMKKNQSAIAKMREALKGDTTYVPAALTLGYLGLRAGDFEGSEKMFRLAASTSSNSVDAKVGLAASLRVRGKNDEARAILAPLYKQRASDKRIAWNYALALSDSPPTQQEAIGVLKKYFESGSPIAELDSRANSLMNKLMMPPPKISETPKEDTSPGNQPAAARKVSE